MESRDPIARLLASQPVVVLDGGLATELEQRGCDLTDELWSARLLIDDPGAIERLHRDYLEAGADSIVSASYQATVAGFEARGQTTSEAERAIRRSVEIALDARDSFWDGARSGKRARPLVAASIGPYGAYLADGSEYTGDYDLDEEGLYEFHRRRWRLLSEAGADLLACETIPSRIEARALARLLSETRDAFAWFSFSCRDGERISDGSELAAVVAELEPVERIVAIGVNCTAPRYIASLLGRASSVSDRPLVAYPNSGEAWDAERRRWIEGAAALDLGVVAPGWVAAGARLLGGCCRTGPADVQRLRRALLGKLDP